MRARGDHRAAMTTLRAVFLSLLCLAVLPWGAFARHISAPGAVTLVAESVVQRAERPCRGVVLPGWSCAPEVVLGEAAVAAAGPAARTAPPQDARLQDLWWPQQPLDPPKSNE